MDISKKIHALRVEQHRTLEEVGKAVGVGKSTVSKWESGFISNMRRDKIAKLASFLNTTPEYLLGWNEDVPGEPPCADWDGTHLMNIREETGESAEYAALRIGIPVQLYQQYEAGTASPTLEDLKKLADHFRYSADSILGLSWAGAPAPLSPDEQELLDSYRLLNRDGKEYILQTMAMARQIYTEKKNAVPDVEAAD